MQDMGNTDFSFYGVDIHIGSEIQIILCKYVTEHFQLTTHNILVTEHA